MVSLAIPLGLWVIRFCRVILRGKTAFVSFPLMVASIFKRGLPFLPPDDETFWDLPFIPQKYNKNWVRRSGMRFDFVSLCPTSTTDGRQRDYTAPRAPSEWMPDEGRSTPTFVFRTRSFLPE
jgi:hypothetical protein